MANYITIDGGTTNTRLYLVCDRKIKAEIKLSIGAKSGQDVLKAALKTEISRLLQENRLEEKEIACVLASGMITSEYGLCNLPHATLPAGKEELHATMYETAFNDIASIPFFFIRGVKTSADSLENADVMRGEETEVMGIYEANGEKALYVLPGSHSKHISFDTNGKIIAFRTMLTGELFATVMQNTILRDAADFDHAVLCEDMLLEGYDYCHTHGINESLFKTRILKNLFGKTKEECYSFLLGTVLCDEVRAILASEETHVTLGGQKQHKEALAIILRKYADKRVTVLSDEKVKASTALGAVAIYES